MVRAASGWNNHWNRQNYETYQVLFYSFVDTEKCKVQVPRPSLSLLFYVPLFSAAVVSLSGFFSWFNRCIALTKCQISIFLRWPIYLINSDDISKVLDVTKDEQEENCGDCIIRSIHTVFLVWSIRKWHCKSTWQNLANIVFTEIMNIWNSYIWTADFRGTYSFHYPVKMRS